MSAKTQMKIYHNDKHVIAEQVYNPLWTPPHQFVVFDKANGVLDIKPSIHIDLGDQKL